MLVGFIFIRAPVTPTPFFHTEGAHRIPSQWERREEDVFPSGNIPPFDVWSHFALNDITGIGGNTPHSNRHFQHPRSPSSIPYARVLRICNSLFFYLSLSLSLRATGLVCHWKLTDDSRHSRANVSLLSSSQHGDTLNFLFFTLLLFSLT